MEVFQNGCGVDLDTWMTCKRGNCIKEVLLLYFSLSSCSRAAG